MNDGQDPEQYQARRRRLQEKHRNGNGAGLVLSMAAAMFPTPAARDAKGTNDHSLAERTGTKCGEQLPNFIKHKLPSLLAQATPPDGDGTSTPSLVLNPRFVAALMGWPPDWTEV
jgi:hypothetical protein